MNYKEAYRYQNYLKNKISAMARYLGDEDFTHRCREVHFRSAACPTAIDEVVEDSNSNCHDDLKNAENMLKLLESVLSEQQALSVAIALAKRQTALMMDAELEINKTRRAVADIYSGLLEKPSIQTIRSTAYDRTFAVDGTQTSYCYTVERTFTRDYDIDSVKQRYKDLSVTADKISALTEKELICGVVDFSPKWTVQDSLEDMLTSILPE